MENTNNADFSVGGKRPWRLIPQFNVPSDKLNFSRIAQCAFLKSFGGCVGLCTEILLAYKLQTCLSSVSGLLKVSAGVAIHFFTSPTGLASQIVELGLNSCKDGKLLCLFMIKRLQKKMS